VINEDMVDQAW